MRSYSKLVHRVSAYAVISIVEKVVPFLMVPIFARILDTDGFGLYLLALSIVDFVMPIISVGSESYLLREYFDQSNEAYSGLIVKILFLLLIAGLVTLLLGSIFLFASSIEIVKLDDILLLVCLSVLRQFNRVRLAVYRVKDQVSYYGAFALSNSILRNFLAYFLLIYLGGWSSILIGYTLVQLLFALFTLFSFSHSIKVWTVPVFSGYSEVLRYGVPVIGHRLGAWLGNSGIRIVTSSVVSVHAVGLLGAAGFYQTILNVIQQSFNSAFVPYLFGLLKSEQRVDLIRVVKITIYYYGAIILVCVLLTLFATHYHYLIFGSGFIESKRLVMPLIATAGLNGLYKIHVNILFYLKDTTLIFRITAISGVATVFLAYILGKMSEIEGVVWAVFAGQMIAYILVVVFTHKSFPLPWKKALIYDD